MKKILIAVLLLFVGSVLSSCVVRRPYPSRFYYVYTYYSPRSVPPPGIGQKPHHGGHKPSPKPQPKPQPRPQPQPQPRPHSQPEANQAVVAKHK